MIRLLAAALLLSLLSLRAELPPLIPREILFGNPERTSPALSPDGARLAWLAPDDKNVLQVWVQTVGKNDAKIVTADKKRGIRQYQWAKDNRNLLYLQDADGDENFHIYGVDLGSGKVRDLTPVAGARAELLAASADHPNEVLITLNARDRTLFDVHRLDLKTDALTLDTKNFGDVSSWTEDAQFRIRGANITTEDGGTDIQVRADEKSEWKSLVKVGPKEIVELVGFTPDGKSAILISSIDRDTAAVIEKNIETGAERMIAEHDVVDAGGVIRHPRKHHVEAVIFAPGRDEWRIIDASIAGDIQGIRQLNDGDFGIVNRTTADDVWLVAFQSDRSPGRYYRWDRNSKKGELLLTTRPKLDGLKLAEMKTIVIPARDRLQMHSYLTLPVGVEPKNLPMVLLPHGGPWARDGWGFNSTAQWLANRGYAVLQPNFRGSTGYGKNHLNAGDREWGLKMHTDLIDACNWAIKEGYADPKRIGIMGGSYGGYSALAGVTFTPEFFACSVDIVGPSNLKTLLSTIPPYWKAFRANLIRRMGDIDDPKDAELIRRASPVHFADKIVRPLLIGQGANDPRVKQDESEQIVAAIEKNNGSVTYVLYPDEGHGFQRPENRTDFNARAEKFLAERLGGRYEPMQGDKMPGSTAVVREIKRSVK